jgi:hypothetical protein
MDKRALLRETVAGLHRTLQTVQSLPTGHPALQWMTVQDLMALFQTEYRVTLRRVRNDLIPLGAVIKIGNRYLIRVDTLEEYLVSKTVVREPKPRTDSIWMKKRRR